MILLIYFLFLFGSGKAHESACDEGWLPFEETHSCYRVFFDPYAIDIVYAHQRCQFFAATLASIHSKAELKFINEITTQSHKASTEGNWVLVGATRNTSGKWSWYDQTPFDFEPWKATFPKWNQDCAAIASDGLDKNTPDVFDSDMVDQSCGKQWYRFLCKKPSKSRVSRSYALKCMPGWHYSYKTKACYRDFLFTERVNYDSAQAHCQKFDSSLTTVRNRDELQFLIKLCYQYRAAVYTEMPLVGLRQTSDNQFSWIDGDVATWLPWSVNEPKQHFIGNGASLACDTYGDLIPNIAGKLVDNKVTEKAFQRFICKKTLPKPGCNSCELNQVEYGDACSQFGSYTADGCKTMELDCAGNNWSLKFNAGLANNLELPTNLAKATLTCNEYGDFTLPGSKIPIESASCQRK